MIKLAVLFVAAVILGTLGKKPGYQAKLKRYNKICRPICGPGQLCSESQLSKMKASKEIRCTRLQKQLVAVNDVCQDWTEWSTCSKQCGGGEQTRSRSCQDVLSVKSVYQEEETQTCNTQACPVNGGYTPFTSWSSCSASCGVGTRTRTRSCTNPAPANGGENCQGPSSQTESCKISECPVNGGYTPFTPWSSCSASCGVGTRTRTRSCTNPAPAHGGENCQGPSSQTKSCKIRECLDCGQTLKMGCFRDKKSRAIYGGIRFRSSNIDKCKAFALKYGWNTFAIQNKRECFTSRYAANTYNKYGASTGCRNGRGGRWAMNVYKIGCLKRGCRQTVVHLGCYKDKRSRAIYGGIRFKSSNPVTDCESYARARGYSIFTVQNKKECFTSSGARLTYQKYGRSTNCRNGRGGRWAQDVYQIATQCS